MNPQKNEKNSKYIRFSNTVRVIALALLISLSSSQIHYCYASLNAIEYNTSQTATNTASIDTKLGNIYTALSTLYSYLSNNGNGVREVLGYIYNYEVSSNSYLYNMWTTMNNATYGTLAQGIKLNDINNNVLAVGGQVADVSSKLLTSNGYLNNINSLAADQVNINWTVLSTSSAFYSDLGTTQLINYNTRTNASNPIYVKVDPVSINDASLFRIKIGIIPQSQFNYNRLINNITFYNASGSVLPMPETYIEFVPSQGFLYLYIYNYTFQNSGITYIKFDMSYDYRYLNNLFSLEYIPSSDIDYYLVQYKGLLQELIDKDFVAEIDGSDLNININDSINVTPIELDVTIGISDFEEVNTISNKLRTWLSTGVGVSALIAALDQLDDSFFTLHNRSVIETINNQYTDFYD